MIKRRDKYADPSWQIDDPALDRSVVTGRTMTESEQSQPAAEVPPALASPIGAIGVDVIVGETVNQIRNAVKRR